MRAGSSSGESSSSADRASLFGPNARRPVVCLITDRHLVEAERLPDVIAAAIEGGVNLVQLREKDLPTRALLDLAHRLRTATAGKAAFLVNSRADVAFAAGADGVHLPADGLPPEGARTVLGGDAIVGQSVHSPEEIAEYAAAGVDYLELGAIFPSRSHPGGPVLGVEAVRSAAIAAAVTLAPEASRRGVRLSQGERGRATVPVIGVGGITPENVGSVIEAGAAGVAVISTILGDPDPRAAAARLCAAAAEAWRRASPAGTGRPPARRAKDG